MTEPGQARRRWTSDEDEELRLLLDAGKIAPEIALKLNRTPQAIYARLQRLYRKRTAGRKVLQHRKQWGLKAKGK
jgi:DNA-binding CsgD family transcriptional regulator